ncbi:sn-glycerol-3-phosphate ABC transporter permease UgpA [Pikeienuella piscinae]|uniref:sn-glycerol-3-phosphate transport system permease protein UgpA n=1 Tax=Pikeienuella piscinae TaxID=2748098 RepID=A0A7L5BT35_9RHOB|nr:sn-glycerol-3-phosphate ABC transporter permease UgpA [Pikeienuella piscinae]QIE54980.1 sn-glycerol-3-phosphate ABC transporter permease UgpA [Pikeienuella piscinae]
MRNTAAFDNKILPYVLLLPQLFVTLAFFVWPSIIAIIQAFTYEDAFGGSLEFVWFENYKILFSDQSYLHSAKITLIFSFGVTALGLIISLFLAVMANRQLRGVVVYKTLLVWPYAVAPAVAGVLWGFLFNPSIGLIPYFMASLGLMEWNHRINPGHAQLLVIFAAVWNQIGYNFIFFLAGLYAIPRSLIEAAAIDGAGPVTRFFSVVFPLLSPTAFFLLVINVIYAFFSTFGLIDALTKGGPSGSTQILVYKIYIDGFRNQDFGSSAAQSTILIIFVAALTVVQFKYIERRVHY